MHLLSSPVANSLLILRPCLAACRPAARSASATQSPAVCLELLRALCACLRGGGGEAAGGEAAGGVLADMAALLDGSSSSAPVGGAQPAGGSAEAAEPEEEEESDWDDWDEDEEAAASGEAGPRLAEVGFFLEWLGQEPQGRAAMLDAAARLAEADGALLCSALRAGRAAEPVEVC